MRMKLFLTLALLLAISLTAFTALAQVTNFTSVTLSQHLVVGGKSTMTGGLIFPVQSSTVITDFSITPTRSYIVLSSAAAYTSSTTVPVVTTTATTGQVIFLHNGNASDVLVIDGTGGTVECKANISLGASDTLTLIFNGSVWNCLAGYDNS